MIGFGVQRGVRVVLARCAIGLLGAALVVATQWSPVRAADTGPINGSVIPLELRCVQEAILRARLNERVAIYALEDLRSGAEDGEDARADALEHVEASMDALDEALEALSDFEESASSSDYPAEFVADVRGTIDDVKAWDRGVLRKLDEVPGRRRALIMIHQLQVAIRLKSRAVLLTAGVERPEVPRFRSGNEPERSEEQEDLESLGLAVQSRGAAGLAYTFTPRTYSAAGLFEGELDHARARGAQRVFGAGSSRKVARKRRGPVDRFLSFRGTKKSKDGLAFLRLQNPLVGPYEVRFTAGLFRPARRRHSPDAAVTVELDVRGRDPLDFFVVSTRYVPADAATQTPAGVQVFTGSTGGVARGDMFFVGATTVDVVIDYAGGGFGVRARPAGASEGEFLPVGSWDRGGGDERWTLGVGAARLRRGTELGIDDLILTPR